MAIYRWKFKDPVTLEEYTVPKNPSAMDPVFPQRALTQQATTAIGGQGLMWEGALPAKLWNFSGTVTDPDHYEALRHWAYDIHNRILLTDHFGRVLTLVMQSFEATPKRAVGKYWRHDYTCSAYIVAGPTAPTVLVVSA